MALVLLRGALCLGLLFGLVFGWLRIGACCGAAQYLAGGGGEECGFVFEAALFEVSAFVFCQICVWALFLGGLSNIRGGGIWRRGAVFGRVIKYSGAGRGAGAVYEAGFLGEGAGAGVCYFFVGAVFVWIARGRRGRSLGLKAGESVQAYSKC